MAAFCCCGMKDLNMSKNPRNSQYSWAWNMGFPTSFATQEAAAWSICRESTTLHHRVSCVLLNEGLPHQILQSISCIELCVCVCVCA